MPFFKSTRRFICRSWMTAMFFVFFAALAPHVASAKPAVDSTALPAGFSSHVRSVGAAKIHYVIGGHGPAVLLIHGWPETWYEWRKVMPLLAQTHTVIAADLRGIGGSSLEASGYDKKTLAKDLHELMDGLGFAKADVIGHDWGGPVGYAYAAQFRSAVDHLVVVEGSVFGPWSETIEPLWFFHFLRAPGGYAESIITGRERAFLSYFYNNQEMHVVPAFDAEVVALYSKAYGRPGRMAPSYALYRTIEQDVRDNTEFAKTKLTIPVLAIGAQKGIGEGVAKTLHAVADQVTPLMFKNTGHFIPEERPQALAQAVQSFLAGQALPESLQFPE